MIVIPAVDLRERPLRAPARGPRRRRDRVLRRSRGDGRALGVAGAERLHVVDLDGAFAGAPRQTALIAKIVAAVAPGAGRGRRRPARPRGGRDGARDRRALGGGRHARRARRRVPREVCRRIPARIIVAVDARGERVAVKGWTEVGDETVVERRPRARARPARRRCSTPTSAATAPSAAPTSRRRPRSRARSAMPVLASGGVGDASTISRALARRSPGVEGAVVGRALYTGAVDAEPRRAVRRAGPDGGA